MLSTARMRFGNAHQGDARRPTHQIGKYSLVMACTIRAGCSTILLPIRGCIRCQAVEYDIHVAGGVTWRAVSPWKFSIRPEQTNSIMLHPWRARAMGMLNRKPKGTLSPG